MISLGRCDDMMQSYHGQSRIDGKDFEPIRTRSFGFCERNLIRASPRYLQCRVANILSEIRCQFIILARKDEPTPDYALRRSW